MRVFYLLTFILFFNYSFSQILPNQRRTDWSIVGIRDSSTANYNIVNLGTVGGVGDGVTPNDSVLNYVINTNNGTGVIIHFPTGNFLFNQPINLPSNTILRGQGATNTTITSNLNGNGNSIAVNGSKNQTDTSSITQQVFKDSSFIYINNPLLLSTNDWIIIEQNDSSFITSNWAYNTVGQIMQVKNVIGNKIELKSPLRVDIPLNKKPKIIKLLPVQNIGIECLKLKRIDDTAPQHNNNILFNYTVNSWVHNIESENCTYAHISATNSSNLSISGSYFHHGFSYGGGGRAYGVMLHYTTNECLVENNIFEHLRHAMIVQAGANGNVFAYNYSTDPYWDSSISNSAGDMVLHGNYPFLNLFEHNICQNIVIDDSHGPNGKYNTFLRNRAESFGIFFSANNSPFQNFLGNEVTNTSTPYSYVNYTIQGTGHLIHANNNKGVIDLPNTNYLPDSSYIYLNKPSFMPISNWVIIGVPNTFNTSSISAKDRYINNNIFSTNCSIYTDTKSTKLNQHIIKVFPNPTKNNITIGSSTNKKFDVYLYNLNGSLIDANVAQQGISKLQLNGFTKGIYLIKISTKDDVFIKRVVKL